LITERHIDFMTYVMMVSGLLVAYGYLMEGFDAWLSGSVFEQYMMLNRLRGPYWIATWITLVCNVMLPQLLWFRRVRRAIPLLFVLCLVINLGMWFERYVIVITSLHRDFLPSSWGMYRPTRWDLATLIGSMGLFLSLMFLFVRLLPAISMSEVRHLLHETRQSNAESGGAP
jgi:molybdopterin-containing oxidoreductase family membrane subunit